MRIIKSISVEVYQADYIQKKNISLSKLIQNVINAMIQEDIQKDKEIKEYFKEKNSGQKDKETKESDKK